MSDAEDADWKLKLRYGKLTTPFKHFTGIADGIVGADLHDGFSCRPGPAYMAMKTWSSSADETTQMMRVIGQQVGFAVTGRVDVYTTDPEQPPRETPHGYDIAFTPYEPEPRRLRRNG